MSWLEELVGSGTAVRKRRSHSSSLLSIQIFSTMGDRLGDYSRSAMASPMADVDSCSGVITMDSD